MRQVGSKSTARAGCGAVFFFFRQCRVGHHVEGEGERGGACIGHDGGGAGSFPRHVKRPIIRRAQFSSCLLVLRSRRGVEGSRGASQVGSTVSVALHLPWMNFLDVSVAPCGRRGISPVESARRWLRRWRQRATRHPRPWCGGWHTVGGSHFCGACDSCARHVISSVSVSKIRLYVGDSSLFLQNRP